MAGVFGFSADDARRIGDAVREVEASRSGPLKGVPPGGANPGVRIMLGKRSPGAWAKGGVSAVVTAYAGAHPAADAVGTVVAWNYFAELPTAATASLNWVGLSNNGFGWIVIAAEC